MLGHILSIKLLCSNMLEDNSNLLYLSMLMYVICMAVGMPKGAILTHGAIVSDVAAVYKHFVSCVFVMVV